MSNVIHRVVPAGSIDTHVHVFDPNRFAYASGRDYTPASADLQDLQAFAGTLGLERFVFVQPSVYGTDNSALLAALEVTGPERSRGVAVIGPETTDQDIASLHAAGVRGLRLNASSNPDGGAADVREALQTLMARAEPLGLAVELFCSSTSLAAVEDIIASSPVPIILDHFGGATVADDGTVVGLDQVIRFLALPHVWVKLSAAYRIAKAGAAAPQIPSIVRALVEARADRLVWASDWPHTGGGAARKRRGPAAVEPFREIDDAAEVSTFLTWIGPGETARQILVDNPARLFRFPSS
ncbi:amidohydrolase family protein [Pseudarthrobacter sp. NPDC058119]|uniref:amidohydrolase family protein n=1 Tax=Pseudarthrobacter sp. NPDC058119 TaxID=3346348 RepID=UPI0036DF5FDB